MRQVLSLLTSDMLVERIDQRGFRAAPASRANFEELLTLRCALEDISLRQSIVRATSDWGERLVLSHHRMTRGKDTPTFEDAHKAFHMTLLTNAASPILEHYCSQLYELNIKYRNMSAVGASYERRDVSAEHEEILKAAVEGDADEASAVLLHHCRLTDEYLATQLGDL